MLKSSSLCLLKDLIIDFFLDKDIDYKLFYCLEFIAQNLIIFRYCIDRIGGVINCVLASIVVDREFVSRSG
jgi:hypothetical protein